MTNPQTLFLTVFQWSGRYFRSQQPPTSSNSTTARSTPPPTAAGSGSCCQEEEEVGGGSWLTTTTGGDGQAASLKALAASSRPSTIFCWTSSNRVDTTAVVDEGRSTEGVVLDTTEDAAVEDIHEAEDDGTVEEVTTTAGVEVEGTGAVKLARIPETDESREYSKSIVTI